jgi:exo-1,4-beta-D-glucosaminidase
LPVVYSDNYITLWPGETATITAKYATGNSGNRAISVKIQGFNVPEFFANDGRTM